MSDSSRWQLNRAGITNVYQYENETLTFRDGRLLLRGINGSGKSTAMNMLLPFLLTGRTRGIDAAGEQTGVLKSWMLSGREEKQPVGYLWVEFERGGVDGEAAEHITVGCGIKANRASDTVVTWWFLTRQRPGFDFDLLEAQVPLSLDALRATIEPDPVFTQDRRADYRREVSRHLFGGADIESFLDLINTVRSPRVGDRVDVELPQYLVSAMPNLSETALIEAARPLDDLDEHRRNVSDLGATEVALAAMIEVYNDYALTELHAEVSSARATSSSVKLARKQLRLATDEVEQSNLAEAQAREYREMLEHQSVQLEQEIHALQRSSAYTEGQQLEDLRRHVQSLEKRAADDEAQHREQQSRQAVFVAALLRSEQLSDERLQLLSDEIGVLTRQSNVVGVPAKMPAITPVPRLALAGVEASEPLEVFGSDSVSAALKAVAGAAATRTADVDTAREQLVRVANATSTVRDTQSAQEQAREVLADIQLRFDDGRAYLDTSRQTWIADVGAWMDKAREVLASTGSMQADPLGDMPLLTSHTELSSADLHVQRRQLESEALQAVDAQQRIVLGAQSKVEEQERVLDEARQLLEELQARTEPEVPVLSWQHRDGPSLADLVDFHDDLNADARAGLEASLEASGLLLATVEKEGVRLQTGDLLVTSAAAVEHPLSTLLTVNVPDALSAVIDSQDVQDILNSIGTRIETRCASVMSVEGEFRLGALTGRHEKMEAEYVGVSARRARLERLRAEAAEQVETARDALVELQAMLGVAEQLANDLRSLRDALPSLATVDSAQAAATALEAELEKSRERLQQRDKAYAEAEQRLSIADDECQRVCRSLALPHDKSGLDNIERTLQAMLMQVQTAIRSAVTVAEATQVWMTEVERWQIAQKDLRKAAEQWRLSREDWQNENARLATLEASMGASYREVVEQIENRERSLYESKRQIPAAREQTESAIRKASDAQNAAENASARLTHLERDCADVHSRLNRVLAVPGLLAAVLLTTTQELVAVPDDVASGFEIPQTTADTQGLDQLIAHVSPVLPALQGDGTSADGVRISLRQRRNALSAGWDAEDHQPDTDLPMSIAVGGPLGQMPLADSLSTVRTQLSQLKALLSEKQDQALRNLLQGLIAREVAERMFEARRLIERMNVRLLSVTTSHGIGVRLRWRRSPELDESTARTVDILGKTPDLRSEEEESVLRLALAEALDEARRLEPDAPYRQLIAQVFDYRRWHEMAILLRRGDDPERRLTRRTPLSEGEKKLVSYLPLFAAVAAACDALGDVGGDQVPRFLLLDDAFAKVSEDNHAALFGLLVALDLDFIATSERLWGTHATVPGLAITEVVRDTALGAILLEHSYWDGKTLTMPGNDDLVMDTWGGAATHE